MDCEGASAQWVLFCCQKKNIFVILDKSVFLMSHNKYYINEDAYLNIKYNKIEIQNIEKRIDTTKNKIQQNWNTKYRKKDRYNNKYNSKLKQKYEKVNKQNWKKRESCGKCSVIAARNKSPTLNSDPHQMIDLVRFIKLHHPS